MAAIITYKNGLPEAIQSLLTLKSDRDNMSFTSYKLAKEINVDRSLIQRILNGEVENPRIDTLMKIIQFFSNDGFRITLDDLLNWQEKVIDVSDQVLSEGTPQKLALYQMEKFNGEPIATTTVVIPKTSPSTIAVFSSKDIKPIFTSGSIFVVDMLKKPQNENLIMMRNGSDDNIVLRKWLTNDGKVSLHNFDDGSMLSIDKHHEIKIIGVVIRINIKA